MSRLSLNSSYQLSSQKKHNFCIYYNNISEAYLDVEEKRLIETYKPHLNSSSVKKKKILPTETLLRETILKLPDLLIVLGIELPRREVDEKAVSNDWWLKKKLKGLRIVHIGIDREKLSEFTEKNYEIHYGILSHAFNTRKSYSNVWKSQLDLKLSGMVSSRLLVNGYAIEISSFHNLSHFSNKTKFGTLAGEKIKVIDADILEELKLNLDSRMPKEFINRIEAYLGDPIVPIFKDEIDNQNLSNQIYKIKEEYKQGKRGVGSRTAKQLLQD